MAIPKIIADFETSLSTAIAIGGTTFSIASATDDDNIAIPPGLYYFTVDNGSSNKEYLAGTVAGTSVTSVLSVSRQGVETSGAARAHRVGASVILTDFATYKKYIDSGLNAGAANASASLQGLVQLPTASQINAGTATGSTGAALGITPDALLTSNYGLNIPSAAEKASLVSLTSLTGAIFPYAGRTAPSGYLIGDGSAVSRTTYVNLFGVIAPSGTCTATIASPGVFTKTAHGYVAGDRVHFTTTGGLPSGLSTNTDYYVIAAGLTANAFEVALSPGGVAVNTSGSQSGVHTVYASAFGKGDGSTTFNLPDLRAKMPIGLAASAPTETLVFESAAVDTTNDWVTILNTVFPSQGQKVQLTTTGALPTGLSLATDYYIIRVTSTTIAFASSQANANAATPVKIDLTAAGSGVTTMTFTNRAHTVLGRMGGEETHGLSVSELAAHTHTVGALAGANLSGSNGGVTQSSTNTGSTGGDTQHNIMSPFIVLNYIIKT